MTTAQAEQVTHRYQGYGACAELFNRRDPEVLICGPAGTGKSRACLEKLHAICMLTPDVRALIVRKTLTSLAPTALKTYREQVAVEAIAKGNVYFHNGGPQDPPQYRYNNGSTITVGGMDRPTRIMSSEYDVIYVQEATELEITDWENLTSRLRNWRISFQQLLADCNPDHPQHWLKSRADSGRTTLLQSEHEDNPRLFDRNGTLTPGGAQYIAKLDALTGVRYLRLRKGLWAAAEGVIYDEWNPSLHVVEPFKIPLDWERLWAVDFGFTNPFVLQCWAIDPDGRMFLYRELYRTRRTVDQHARTILSLVTDDDGRWLEPEPMAIVCDHDAENRARFEKELGMGTVPAVKTVSDGIEAVQVRMRPQKPDDRPRLCLFKGARQDPDPELQDQKKPSSTEEEIPGYVWDSSGNRGIKETPLKINDHGCDAMRYAVAMVDNVGQPNLRWL